MSRATNQESGISEAQRSPIFVRNRNARQAQAGQVKKLLGLGLGDVALEGMLPWMFQGRLRVGRAYLVPRDVPRNFQGLRVRCPPRMRKNLALGRLSQHILVHG